MQRLPPATACLLLAACSAPDAHPGVAFGSAADSLIAPAPAPAAETAEPTEAELRDRLARAADPTDPALALVRLLDREERLREALEVLDQAIPGASAPGALQVARAGVLRDLGRRREAVAVLLGLVADEGPEHLHPGLLFELAELHWLEGDPGASRAMLATLRRLHAGSPWLAASAASVDALAADLAAGDRPHRLRARDLLGNLRGAPDPVERQRALEQLLGLGGELAAQAAVIGGSDAEPQVRATAVRLAVVDSDALAELCAVALADPSPVVRAAAAARAQQLPRKQAMALLLPTLSAEEDADAFVALHQALCRVAGGGPDLPATGVLDPAGRAATVAAWRRRWEM